MKWRIVGLAMSFVCCLAVASIVQARDSEVGEMLSSLAHPSDSRDADESFDTNIEKILSETFVVGEGQRYADESTADGRETSPRSDTRTASLDPLAPGAGFREMVGRGRDGADVPQPVTATSRSGAEMLDEGAGFDASGSLVGDPVHLYSTFEILVDHKDYTLKLYAAKGDGEKVLLFECKTGLGSSEYPTPRGTFYLCRIFDDKPLWIPPPSDWAYGESPSHNVYGGHMMPLFKKISAKNEKSPEVLDEVDIVAPEMKMVDSGGYRVHGTNSPWSIGQGQSHGCVRLKNDTAKGLADTLKMYVGTTTRGRTPNGSFIALARPVKLVLH